VTDLTPDDLAVSRSFAPARKRPWLTPALLGALSFAITAVSIRSAVERQAPILDSMEIQPVSAAATLAYGWGAPEDAVALEHELLALVARPHAPASSHARGQPDFDNLRKMDADIAKLRLAILEDAPTSTFQSWCAQATIRCTPYNLERLVEMVRKQRMVATPTPAAH
jgi:hypothetical protein